MVAFRTDALTRHPPDFALARDGGVALFDAARLDAAISELAAVGYDDKRLDLSHADEAGMHRRFQRLFSFPDHFGHNIEALDECLADVPAGDYGWDSASTGLVVTVFSGSASLLATTRPSPTRSWTS